AEWIRARLSRLPAASALTRRADAAGARRLRLRRVDERPLVVVIAAVVETDRFSLALPRHAHDAAGLPGALRSKRRNCARADPSSELRSCRRSAWRRR